MPELNRRRFLQVVSAAGLAPVMPALPVSAAAPRGVTTAQMLWASMHARAGSVQNAVGVARSMGIHSTAARGIYTKLAHSGAMAAHGASHLGRVAHARPAPVRPAPTGQAPHARSFQVDMDRVLGRDLENTPEPFDADDIDEISPNTMPET
jgi:hypothetical protein